MVIAAALSCPQQEVGLVVLSRVNLINLAATLITGYGVRVIVESLLT